MTQPPETNDQAQLIAKLNELYVLTRSKYIMQVSDEYKRATGSTSGYTAFNCHKFANNFPLTDGTLTQHIKGTNTYGVFNANTVNKFLTFDVDYADDEAGARWATLKLLDVLEREFNIARSDMHVSYSGSKGYHVDLFFDRRLAVEVVRKFYTNVLKEAGLSEAKVEFRPTWTQGVKLPLGVHQRTGNRCWFVDNHTLEAIERYDYLAKVETMDAELIVDGAIELTSDESAEFREIVRRTDTTINTVDTSAALQKAGRIIAAGQLIESNTRHNTTLTLASFFNSQGEEAEVAVEAILEILHNTPREYFSIGSTSEMWERETKRLVGIAYERNYTLGNADKPIVIYKSEILAVLRVGTFRQKQLAYAMLTTSKRYGDVFYLTMNSAMQMIGTKSKPTVNTAIKKLAEQGFIEYVRKGAVDKARSAQVGRPHFKPNKYRLCIAKPELDEESVKVTASQSVVDVAHLLCDAKELRQNTNRHEYNSRWAQ